MQNNFVVEIYIVVELFDAGTGHGIDFCVVLGTVDKVAAFYEIGSDESGKD